MESQSAFDEYILYSRNANYFLISMAFDWSSYPPARYSFLFNFFFEHA